MNDFDQLFSRGILDYLKTTSDQVRAKVSFSHFLFGSQSVCPDCWSLTSNCNWNKTSNELRRVEYDNIIAPTWK